MIARFICVMLVTSAFAATSLHAQTASIAQGVASAEQPVVLELFTSQGCSSCPAADALLKEFATRPDVIALSMPVDYWDYLGWKDTLASPKFSKRQRAYAKLRGDGKIYTPQVVVNGRQHAIGSARADIESAIAAGGSDPAFGPVRAKVADATISIEIPSSSRPVDDATVWLVVVQAETRVDVRGGENRGRALTYYNIVRDLLPLGMWSGVATTIKQHTAAVSGNVGDRYAILVQQGIGGPILSAAWADRPR